MESSFLKDWLNILRNCSYDNTYKMAWAKAITEICLETGCDKCCSDGYLEITLEQIAHKVIKYYWNQTVHFDLIQGSNPLKPPVILSLTRDLIKLYREEMKSLQPVRYERAYDRIAGNALLDKEYVKTVRKTISALKSDVSYRFLNLEGRTLENIYSYSKGADSLFISRGNQEALRENAFLIFETINYRWALILETFNNTPRICKKVRIIDETEIRRQPLTKYKKYLDMVNPERVCFVCGERIEEKDLSIDHVIPWSYMYSDDVWNLVYAHKSCNSTKSNVIPCEETIRKLKERNRLLLKAIDGPNRNKVVEELRLAIANDYVDKFWVGCQG